VTARKSAAGGGIALQPAVTRDGYSSCNFFFFAFFPLPFAMSDYGERYGKISLTMEVW